MKTTTERVFQIFKELNQIPRPSHHEERVADYLCRFAERLNLPYKRDKENCVVISKPATQGYEGAEPVVLLNHMDMVCVGMSDPLNTPIDAYIENGWMKARGTSLGADNGIGLSMALAWQEDQQSAFLQLTSDTFQDVLGWRPRMVAMHFVLEAGFFVEHYPGIQIASIGPRIVEPHSTSERVELATIEDIWQVLIELLKRLAVKGQGCE